LKYGLEGDEAHIIERIFSLSPAADSERVMGNLSMLDRHFKEAYQRLETEQERSALFAARRRIEAALVLQRSLSNARLESGMEGILYLDCGGYPVTVLIVRKESILIERPRDSIGEFLKDNDCFKGSARLAFFSRLPYGYAFEGRIVSQTKSPWGPALEFHLKEANPHRFGAVNEAAQVCREAVPCLLAPNRSSQSSGIQTQASKLSTEGCFVDVSNAPGLESLKQDFDINMPVRLDLIFSHACPSVSGIICRVNRNGERLLRIRFVKLSPKASNAINAAALEYNR
jgi:hypothetical protein